MKNGQLGLKWQGRNLIDGGLRNTCNHRKQLEDFRGPFLYVSQLTWNEKVGENYFYGEAFAYLRECVRLCKCILLVQKSRRELRHDCGQSWTLEARSVYEREGERPVLGPKAWKREA